MDRTELFAALDKYERFVVGRGLRAQINLTGGEPLRHPDFFPLAREIRRRGMDLGVLSNGTLIGEETAERLAELEPVFVQVSLDGTRRAHDAIRGRGAYRSALEGIDALKRKGVRVNVSFTAQRENKNQLLPLALVCRAHHVDKLWFDRVVIPREEDTERLSLSTEEFRRLTETAARLRKRGLVACDRLLPLRRGRQPADLSGRRGRDALSAATLCHRQSPGRGAGTAPGGKRAHGSAARRAHPGGLRELRACHALSGRRKMRHLRPDRPAVCERCELLAVRENRLPRNTAGGFPVGKGYLVKPLCHPEHRRRILNLGQTDVSDLSTPLRFAPDDKIIFRFRPGWLRFS